LLRIANPRLWLCIGHVVRTTLNDSTVVAVEDDLTAHETTVGVRLVPLILVAVLGPIFIVVVENQGLSLSRNAMEKVRERTF